MQTLLTFLPYPNFIGSAKVLDRLRLGRQRVENLQIMQALLGKRLTNTASQVPTGEYRRGFFDKNEEEVPLEDLDVFDYWYERSVPVTRLVDNPKSEWRVIENESLAWQDHPVVGMWAGYEHLLLDYQRAICEEWTRRETAAGNRYSDMCLEKTTHLYFQARPLTLGGWPDWLGNEELHLGHQSLLLRKHPIYYRQFFPLTPDNLPLVYPNDLKSR